MRKAAWAGTILGGLALLFLGLCGFLNLAREPLPVNRAAPPPHCTRIAVLGDAQKGLLNLTRIARHVQEQEKVDFILHTGDLVSTNDQGHYRLAALALERAGLRVPFLVVPGNHDVKGGPERFRSRFGELERSFVTGGVAFLTVDNSSGTPPDTRRLEERIAATGKRKSVVLAMHVPPYDVRGDILPEYQPFLKWLETSGVDYVLSGHLHTYLRKTQGGSTIIANGVGGDSESWQFDQNVHATILDIADGQVSDRKIELPPERGVGENLEHLAIGHVAEAYRQRPFLSWAGTLLLAVLTGFCIGVVRQKP